MSDFYGIDPGTIPGFAELNAGRFMGVGSLPEDTVQHMLTFMQRLRAMHRDDQLAFEICVRHVASVIEDQRRAEGRADPREDSASLPQAAAVVGIAPGWASFPVALRWRSACA